MSKFQIFLEAIDIDKEKLKKVCTPINLGFILFGTAWSTIMCWAIGFDLNSKLTKLQSALFINPMIISWVVVSLIITRIKYKRDGINGMAEAAYILFMSYLLGLMFACLGLLFYKMF